MTVVVWFVSRVILVTGSAGYAKANSRYIVGLCICCVLCIAELYVLMRVTAYVPPGPTKPLYYQALDLKRLDCISSDKGPKLAGSYRDCDFGQGQKCTLTEPCTPCRVDEFMSDDVKKRVRNNLGNCKICELGYDSKTLRGCEPFVEGEGPYCYYRGITRVVELRDCGTCCYSVNQTQVDPDLASMVESSKSPSGA